jgi:hypothetical protein
LVREQQPLFGTGFWHLFRTHGLITLSTGISTTREKIAGTFFSSAAIENYKLSIREVLTIIPQKTLRIPLTGRWEMKRLGVYVFTIGLMFGSLLLQYNPASATWQSDTMAHFGSDAQCSDHNPSVNGSKIPLGAAPQTFWLCKRNSGATTWSAVIKKDGPTGGTVCKLDPAVPVPTTPPTTSFTCNITAPGTYKGTLTYYIGTTSFLNLDYTWTIP